MLVDRTLWILLIWYAASLTAFWAVFRLRMWTEHVGTRETYRVSVSWWQRALYLPHNTWYHYEHHRWPSIPYWNLPRARALDRSEPVIPLNKLLASYSKA
jgi:fatty acid desaturase